MTTPDVGAMARNQGHARKIKPSAREQVMETVTLKFPGHAPARAAGQVITAMEWDEPAGCTSPRGWLRNGGTCVGFYLDYGPEHYRTGHETEIYPGKVVSFCQPDQSRPCKECQPGNILAVRYPDGPRSEDKTSRYVQTITAARFWVQTGREV
jgi:hypothetical protein